MATGGGQDNTGREPVESIDDTEVNCDCAGTSDTEGEKTDKTNSDMHQNNETEEPNSPSVEVQSPTTSKDIPVSNGPLSDENIQAEVQIKLEKLKDQLATCTDIPSILFDVSLECLKPSTIEYLSYHLDPDDGILSSDAKCKDFRGMAEWIGLESIFIKYISRAVYQLKTREVLSKWLTLEEEPLPTIKNLRECLIAIDRPDVLEDMSIKIARDAVSWKMTQFEARTKKHGAPVDTSWQLTRHDVVSMKKTMYTACLLYADEDELMAQLIIKLYKNAYKDALFFLPQFDLKHGKYELDTTARVIDERCDKKVVFMLSEYFYASHICQFAVNYAAAHGTGHGNLIPFHLTRNITSVPNVLKGIAGIRWFRKGTREHTWEILTESLLAEKIENKELLADIKDRIIRLVDKDKEFYLQDPPYDDDVEPPGEPIEVIEPEGSSSMPSSAEFELQRLKMEEEISHRRRNKWKFLKQIKRAIWEKVFRQPSTSKGHIPSSTSQQPNYAMRTFKVTETPNGTNTSTQSTGYKSSANTQPQTQSTDAAGRINDNSQKSDDSSLGAVGGNGLNSSACNDLNTNIECQRRDKSNVELNILESEISIARTRNENLDDGYRSTIIQRRQVEGDKIHSNGICRRKSDENSDIVGTDKQENQSNLNCKTSKCDVVSRGLTDEAEAEYQALIAEDIKGENCDALNKDKEAGTEAEETDALIPDSIPS